MFCRLLAFSLSVLLTAGCASSGSDSTSPPASAAGGTLYGVVLLDDIKRQAEVQAFLPGESTPIWTGRTDPQGAFAVPAFEASEVRLVVTPAGEEPVQVTVDPTRRRLLCPNYITTMIDFYRQDHPQATLGQAEAAIRRTLALKPAEKLEMPANGPQSPFSHVEFKRVAGANGVRALAREVARQADTQVRPFVYETRYAAVHRAIYGRPRPVRPAIRAAEGDDPGLFDGFGAFVFQELLDNPLDNVESDVVGWFLGLLGVGGGGVDLGAIQAQLNAIQSDVEQLNTTIVQAAKQEQYTTLLTGLQPAVTATNTFNTELQNAVVPVASPAASPPPLVPTLVPGNVNQILQDGQNALTNLQLLVGSINGLNPASNIVLVYNQLTSANLGSATPSAASYYYDLRVNNTTYQIEAQLDYWRANILLACNVLAEVAHATILPSSTTPPATAMNSANEYLQQASLVIQQAQGLVPIGMENDGVLVDQAAQLMWFLVPSPVFQFTYNGFAPPNYGQDPAPLNYVNSLDTTTQYPDATAAPWQIPTQAQLTTLYNRIQQNPTGQLAALGFGNWGSPYPYPNFAVLAPTNGNNNVYGVFDMTTGTVLSSQDQPLPTYCVAVRPLGNDDVLNRTTRYGNAVPQDYLTLSVANQTGTTVTLPAYIQVDLNHGLGDQPVGPYNISNLCFFTSSSNTVQVSNLQPNSGTVTGPANASGPVNVTASYYTNVGVMNATLTLNVAPQAANATLTSLLVSPPNPAYASLSGSPPTQQFYATGFYSDGTVADLTSQATWSVSPAGTGFFTQTGAGLVTGLFTFNQTLYTANTSLANVTATLPGGFNATAVLGLPFATP